MDDDESTVAMPPLSKFSSYGTTEQVTRLSEVSTRLVCLAGPDLGASFKLEMGAHVIGRGFVAVRLSATDVSRNHARIVCEQDAFIIEDLGSRNRTKVNGIEIKGRVALRYGDRIGVGVTLLMLTHHDELEMRVQQMQRLDAMTAAVSGLAHDFNNALSVIVAGIEMIELDLPSDDRGVREQLRDMQAAATAATSLAARLVKLGRGGSVPHEDVDMAELVREVVGMARRVIDTATIELSTRISPGTSVRGSHDELQQALLNLCLNARDAMPSGGGIWIEARVIELDRAAAASKLVADQGNYVELTVRDSGTGMTEAVAARIFEPFFTTKDPSKGTGLGLAMTHVTISRHGGSIDVDSRLGVGTTFRILLPASRV